MSFSKLVVWSHRATPVTRASAHASPFELGCGGPDLSGLDHINGEQYKAI
jgi:hypothetical protein